MVYEMVTGVTPWHHPNICTLYDLILSSPLTWPNLPDLEEEARDFVNCLLVRDSQDRLGGGGRGAAQIREAFIIILSDLP